MSASDLNELLHRLTLFDYLIKDLLSPAPTAMILDIAVVVGGKR